MHSEVAKYFDNKFILDSTLSSINILELLENEYGPSNYGNIKYTKDEIYWIGYIYRYFSYTYNYSSTQVYKIVKPKELKNIYMPYHSLDPTLAIKRILESKNLFFTEEEQLQRQLNILKKLYKKG